MNNDKRTQSWHSKPLTKQTALVGGTIIGVVIGIGSIAAGIDAILFILELVVIVFDVLINRGRIFNDPEKCLGSTVVLAMIGTQLVGFLFRFLGLG